MRPAASERRTPAVPAASAAGPLLVLIGLAAVAWVVTVERMQGMDMGPGTSLGGLGWFVGVWVAMMAAMMLPSLSPMAVAVTRGAGGALRTLAGTVLFAAGYLAVWLAVGLVAYALVEGVRSLGIGFLAWPRAGRYIAGGVLLGAALYELTPLKARSLGRCRDARLMRARRGPSGALRSGIAQGGFCVGCSGALMAGLFALGVMSISWMVVIAAMVAVEKLLPWELASSRAIAVLLVVLGLGVALVPHEVPGLTVPAHAMGMRAPAHAMGTPAPAMSMR